MDSKAEQIGEHPLRSVSISWHNIQVFSRPTKKLYEVWVRGESPKEIIRRVSGEVKAGELLGIMGASGAGKTTLLNVLTARNLSKVRVHGVVRLNGEIAETNTITSLSSYVQQEDLFMPTLTVREHLIFQASLKMSQNTTKAERNDKIEELLKQFNLGKCADTYIGGSTTFKGISGGEAKRLAFASEVLTNPSIMFCDEPTSGLDSYMAENVVKSLKKMSSQGRTIICTIHQPSSQVFELFQHLLLMADGRVAYMGPIEGAIDFFGTLGYVRNDFLNHYLTFIFPEKSCPPNYNPSDFFIAQLACIPGEEVECKQKINSICDKYLNSVYGQQMQYLQEDGDSVHSFGKKLGKTNGFFTRYRVGFCLQFYIVLWRSLISVRREPGISQIRIAQSIVIAVILGLIYWQQEVDQRGVMNINGALFLLLTNMTFQNGLAVVDSFCAEIPLFLREHHNGMYRVDVYFISKMLAELPVFTAIPVIFVSIYYFMVGFNPQIDRFFMVILVSILVTQCAISFGYLMSCISSSAQMAVSLAPPLLIPLVLMGGFFLNNASVPRLLSWIKYISWFYYSFEVLVINQWSDIKEITCQTQSLFDLFEHLPYPQTRAINSTEMSQMRRTFPDIKIPLGHCWKDGKDVIKQFDFNEDHVNRNLLLLCVIVVVLRIFAFIALYIKALKR